MHISALYSLGFNFTNLEYLFNFLFLTITLLSPVIIGITLFVLYVNKKFDPQKYNDYTERFESLFFKSLNSKQSTLFRKKDIKKKRTNRFFTAISLVLSILSVTLILAKLFEWLNAISFIDWLLGLDAILPIIVLFASVILGIIISLIVGAFCYAIYNPLITKIVYTIFGIFKRYVSIANVKERRR